MRINLNHRKITIDPESRPTAFGRIVARYRLEKQLSIKQFAARVKDYGCAARWFLIESGQQLPTKKDVRLVAELVGLDYEKLLSETETTFSKSSKNMPPENPMIGSPKKKHKQMEFTEQPLTISPLSLQDLTPEKMTKVVNDMLTGKIKFV